MAAVRLEDIIDPVVFRDLPSVESDKLNAFVDSGIAIQTGLFNELANAAGKTAELPFWRDLDGEDEVNYSNDDPADHAVPSKVSQGEQVARKAFVNKGWQATDLAVEIATGENAMQHIRNRTDKYYRTQFEKRLIATARGIFADNEANDGGDMVINIASEDGAAATSANKFSRNAFVSTAFTSGDHFDDYRAIGMHSMIYKQAVEQDDVEDVRDSDGRLLFQAYMGRRIIVDDSLPVIAGGVSGFKYLSVLYGDACFGYGEGSPVMPVEVERDASAGHGGGVETLWRRKTWLLHPFGFAVQGTPAVGQSFTMAELQAAATWDRVVSRKQVPMAFLMTN